MITMKEKSNNYFFKAIVSFTLFALVSAIEPILLELSKISSGVLNSSQDYILVFAASRLSTFALLFIPIVYIGLGISDLISQQQSG